MAKANKAKRSEYDMVWINEQEVDEWQLCESCEQKGTAALTKRAQERYPNAHVLTLRPDIVQSYCAADGYQCVRGIPAGWYEMLQDYSCPDCPCNAGRKDRPAPTIHDYLRSVANMNARSLRDYPSSTFPVPLANLAEGRISKRYGWTAADLLGAAQELAGAGKLTLHEQARGAAISGRSKP